MDSFGSVLSRIRPAKGSEAAERRFIDSVLAKLRSQLRGEKVVLAGSFAKGTYLEGDRDIDIFVLFRHNVEKEALEGIVRAAVENAFGAREASSSEFRVSKPGTGNRKSKTPAASSTPLYQISYAQHPYVRLFLEGRKIDVVPAYEIGEGRHFELRSAVDRSQLHTEYVLANMSSRQKDEVRLLKKFLKANGLYGAEIKVQGFSGYLCELLILKYGTFYGALKSISQWGERTALSINESADGPIRKSTGGSQFPVSSQELLAKFDSPLVFIDPVDPERNVSAVVSRENYFSLIALSRIFLKSRKKAAFFEKRAFDSAQLRSFLKGRHLYCLSFAAPFLVDDVLWGQVRRFYSTLEAALKKEGFETIGHAMDRQGEAISIIFEVLDEPLPAKRIIYGPPLHFAKDCEKFSAQHKGAFIHAGRLAVAVSRAERTVPEMLGKIRALPAPSHLSSVRYAKLYKGAELMKECGGLLSAYAAKKLLA